MERAYPEFKWTGWHQVATEPCWAGQFLWTGMVTFHSGRRQQVFYYMSTKVASREEMLPTSSPVVGAVRRARALREVANRGFLLNWLNGRKARSVASVKWSPRWGLLADDVIPGAS